MNHGPFQRIGRLAVVSLRHALAGPLVRLLWVARPGIRQRMARAVLPPLLPPGPALEDWVEGRVDEPTRLKLFLEGLGGSFVKLGQMLALQPDLLPETYCNALFDLLDRVTPVPTEAIERVLREELGEGPEALFDTFDPRPLACASVGQVHVATVDGRKVAVKVQRPGVRQAFAGDIKLMRGALALIRTLRLERFHWLLDPLDEFIAWTREELDYRFEARSMAELRRQRGLDGRLLTHQRVPAVVDHLSTSRILVVEFLEGATFLEVLRARDSGDEVTLHRLRREGFDPQRLARNLVDNFLTQVFVFGIFHADLHPANLMILPGNTVGYIDFGITGVLSPYSRRHLIAMTQATARGDLEAMEDAMLKVSVCDADADPEAFSRGLRRLALDWYEGVGPQRRLRRSFTVVMLDMLRLSRETGVWPERDVIKYVRSSMAIDGLIRRFSPDLDLGAYLADVCQRHLRWHALESRTTTRHLLAWSTAQCRLWFDGALRAAKLVDRLVDRHLAELHGPLPTIPHPQHTQHEVVDHA